MREPLVELIRRRAPGFRLFGLAPPRRDADPGRLEEIAARQRERLGSLPLDGIVVAIDAAVALFGALSRLLAPGPEPE